MALLQNQVVSSTINLQFREDLNEAKQCQAIAAYHRVAADHWNCTEWKKTTLYRKDHRAMIRMMFVEAVRYNPTRFSTADRTKVLQELHSLMDDSQRNDQYVEALQVLSRLGYFPF